MVARALIFVIMSGAIILIITEMTRDFWYVIEFVVNILLYKL